MPFILQLVVCSALFLLSMLYGGAPERWLSGVLLLVLLAENAYDLWFGPVAWASIDDGRFAFDVVLLALILRLILRANRVYPIVIGAMQVIALVAYAACALLPNSGPIAHAIMDSWAFNAQLAVMAVGLLCHIARKRRLGRDYPDWIEGSRSRADSA